MLKLVSTLIIIGCHCLFVSYCMSCGVQLSFKYLGLKKSVHDEDSREYKYSILTPQSILNSLDQFVIYKIKELCASC